MMGLEEFVLGKLETDMLHEMDDEFCPIVDTEDVFTDIVVVKQGVDVYDKADGRFVVGIFSIVVVGHTLEEVVCPAPYDPVFMVGYVLL